MAKLNLTLPAELTALTGKDVVLFDAMPHLWQRALWGKIQRIVTPEDVLGEEDFYEGLGGHISATVANIQVMEAAGQAVIDAGKVPVGWHVPGEGNLTTILMAWAQTIIGQIKAGKAGDAIVGLGGKATKRQGLTLRGCPDVIGLMRTLPVRAHGSVNGVPCDRSVFGGLALIGAALSTERVQDLLKQAPETSDEDVAAGELRATGWPNLFIPKNEYGVAGPLSEAALKAGSGHLELSFRNDRNALLDIWGAPAPVVAMAIAADLRGGTLHVPHDQFKNASAGAGVKGCWLKDGDVLSLTGAGSKPEKFLSRAKLVLGTGAMLPNAVPSAICFATDKGVVPVTVGQRIPVLLTNWALHGSGQIFVKPGTTLSAATEHRRSIQLSVAEYQALLPTLPKVGDTFKDGEELIPDLLQAEGNLVITFVDVVKNEYSGDVDLKLRWERWVHGYNGFKLKGLGLKGSMMPLVGPNTTDIWSSFPGAEYLVNLESAKGSAFTLAMWAEARGGLTVTADDLSTAELAEYQTWLDDTIIQLPVQVGIHQNMVEAYTAKGHDVHQLANGDWVVKQVIDVLCGHVVAEIEAPLVPHRRTQSSLSLMQAALMADDIAAI